MAFFVRSSLAAMAILGGLCFCHAVDAADTEVQVEKSVLEAALQLAGDNRSQLETALLNSPVDQLAGMEFLIANMPENDLKTLSAEFLLQNLKLAYQAWEEAPWRDQISEPLFFNNILPYANVNESRDAWRQDFYTRCKPIIAGATSPAEAAVRLNQQLFKQLNVKYSTGRNRADQGPDESIRTGLASCTGLSILLIDACRSVGVPARFVGTPLWVNKSGNHSWVEVWDDGWHFTGACEPTGQELDKGWFKGRAATALVDHPLHAIFAVSYQRTPASFPMVWDPRNQSVSAVNVTERYTKDRPQRPEGCVEVQFKIVGENGARVAVPLEVINEANEVVFQGKSKDDRFDRNDHCSAWLPSGQHFSVRLSEGRSLVNKDLVVGDVDQLTVFVVTDSQSLVEPLHVGKQESREAANGEEEIQVASAGGNSESPVIALRDFLAMAPSRLGDLVQQPFSHAALTATQAGEAADMLWESHVASCLIERKQEMDDRRITMGELEMPFYYRVFGEKPDDGRSLFISMHGGGGAPPQVNDGQWENQKRLYTLAEGVYLVPRAPTNTWNLWHQGHIDGMFQRLIENMIVFEGVNPDKVYLMGYSAGGDGVYQLAPRMADRFAAAAMMAGHPNETSPLGLRNLPFTIHMGGKDSAYKRNLIAAEWQVKLDDLEIADPKGYQHWVAIYPDNGHWMDRKDASALPWMSKFRRTPYPDRIVWKQDDVQHERFYWLAVNKDDIDGRPLVVSTLKNQTVTIEQSEVKRLKVRLNDDMINLDKPIQVMWANEPLDAVQTRRTIATLAKTLAERGDRKGMFSVEFEITSPDSQKDQ